MKRFQSPRPALSPALRRDDPGGVADTARMARRATADMAPQRMVGPVKQSRAVRKYSTGGMTGPIRPRAAMAMKGLK